MATTPRRSLVGTLGAESEAAPTKGAAQRHQPSSWGPSAGGSERSLSMGRSVRVGRDGLDEAEKAELHIAWNQQLRRKRGERVELRLKPAPAKLKEKRAELRQRRAQRGLSVDAP